MARILQEGETGFGILIESDAGHISPELNKNILTENQEIKINPKEPILINCVLQKWGVENKNGRIYPKEVLIPQVDEYQKMVQSNSAASECFTPDTKILTKEGWKLIKNISDNEEILTLNRENKKTEYQKITKKINDPYNGFMYHVKSNAIDIKVTPNHRFIIENNGGELIETTAFELFDDVDNCKYFNGKYKLLKKINFDNNNNQRFIFDKLQISSENFYSFMGIYLSEGCVLAQKNIIQITQKKINNILLIENLLNDIGFNYKKRTRKNKTVDFHIKNNELSNYLFKLGKSYEKYIPYELKNNSPHLLKLLFDWFLLGDGRNVNYKERNNTTRNRKSVFSTSKRLIYDLNEIQLKFGGSGNITIDTKRNDRYFNEEVEQDGQLVLIKRLVKRKNSRALFNLNISNTKHIYLDKRSIKVEKYKYSGNIVCVKVPNETIFVMRNGKSLWTLNSDHPDSSIISLHNISHLITKMWWGTGNQEHVLFGQIRLIVTRGYKELGIVSVIGDKILLYLENGYKLGISSRGVGSLETINGKNIVQNDFELIGFDLVATPSTPGAFLYPNTLNIEQEIGEGYKKNKTGLYLKENNNKINSAIDKFLFS
jgi:hypothetical protein